MSRNRRNRDGGFDTEGVVAVAIDKDKSSQNALKWAVDNILQKGQTVVLIHVKPRDSSTKVCPINGDSSLICREPDGAYNKLFLPFRCLCSRKEINHKDVLLEEPDVGKALVEYANQLFIEVLVVGASSKGGLFRFNKQPDIPGVITKTAPDFCTVYVIAKEKVSTKRKASRSPPLISPLLLQFQQNSVKPPPLHSASAINLRADRQSFESQRRRSLEYQPESFRSPLSRRGLSGRSYGDLTVIDSDISFISSERPSTERASMSSDPNRSSTRLSNFSDMDRGSFESMSYGRMSLDINSPRAFSRGSFEKDRSSSPSQGMNNNVEAEMRKLKLELKQTMEMYSTACKEALTEKQKATKLQRWKLEEEARQAEAAAMKALKEKTKAVNLIAHYRKYCIEEIEDATEFFNEKYKIGEGGHGPVYKCYLDQTPVAVKALRIDAARGRSQFQQEIEVLSSIRHRNMVPLLGACPECGCLVYEFMDNGSLEDHLFRKGDIPPLSWQSRFRIAAEIGTVLLFLHQTKPEPLVHRDLKPANIFLDQNLVIKVDDVGLDRLVPQSVANAVTQFRMTSTDGTGCYIDPEYQRTGVLGLKSDIYSLGIMFLQLITGKQPMGLTRRIKRAIEKGNLEDKLDPNVSDWPVEETIEFAKLALKCAEKRQKDRPDLSKDILPVLDRLRTLAEESNQAAADVITSPGPSPTASQTSSPKL